MRHRARHTLGCALLCSALLPGALHAIVEDDIERRAIMPAQRQPGVDAPAVIELTDPDRWATRPSMSTSATAYRFECLARACE